VLNILNNVCFRLRVAAVGRGLLALLFVIGPSTLS
jgi:hypothetical protein